MAQNLAGRVRLGEFELDLYSGELRASRRANGNGKVVLREQPFQVLRMLIARGGKIVTREEIKKKLWPNDTIVDFDHSINVAIGILRRALGDSASDPQYIETLARRGYRLLVDTEVLQASAEVTKGEAVSANAALGLGSLIGKKVSHYRVLEVIGGGGMGMVFKAEDLKLGRRVALKFLPEELADDPGSLQRLEREAQTASALNHPNICTIYEIEEYEHQPFIVMELLEGSTLLHHLSLCRARYIPVIPLLDFALQICDGLQAAHDKNIIHRDIKPANIFLTTQGPVKILDFGLAKLASTEELAGIGSREVADFTSADAKQPSKDADTATSRVVHGDLTRTGIAIGTAGYMSPEQVRKEKLDARTDLFSFGLVLYEMAAGRRAFTGDTAAVVHDAILNQTPAAVHDVNSTVPRGLNAVIAKALEKDRSRRYQSALEMRADLQRVRREMHPVRRQWRRSLGSAALFLVVAAAAWIYRDYRNRVTLSPDDTIVIADVSNQTGDPLFDDALNTALRVGLEQTPYLNVLASDKVSGTLKNLNLPGEAKVAPALARQVCLRTDSKMIIASSIADAGNRFRIELNAIACQSGNTIAQVREVATRRTEIVHLLGVSAVQLRGKLGEPAASLAKFNRPLEQATSSSLEAVQQLAEGYKRHLAMDIRGAIQHYQRATGLDPDFGLAYAALGAAHGTLGQLDLAAADEKKAYELRTRMTELTRFHIEDLYYDFVTGEQDKAYPVLLQWVQTFPRDVTGHNNFARCLRLLAQHDRAADEAREAARLLPTPWSYNNSIVSSIAADRLEEARATFDEAQKRKFDTPDLRENRVLLAFLQKDEPSMEEQWGWARGKPIGDSFLVGRSKVEAYHGQFREARRLTEQAVNAVSTSDTHERAYTHAMAALREAEVGNSAQAQRIAAKALASGPNRIGQLGVALAFARAGNLEQAQKLAGAISQHDPLNTVVQNFSLPTIRAAMKLHENDPAAAVEILRPTVKYDLAFADGFNDLYPAYIRGLAYLQMGEGRLASAEFQKLLDHPGIVGRTVTGALSHLQLARAHKLMGDEPAARKSYEDFLSLWKDADPDIPIYQQAKAEYAKLRTRLNGPF
ncbi:MAG TPA: protein kinase [Candidatus Saccharimonadales bacterium]|nr:protein kinase [Candidatus Saccharimonadales bacterium]